MICLKVNHLFLFLHLLQTFPLPLNSFMQFEHLRYYYVWVMLGYLVAGYAF